MRRFVGITGVIGFLVLIVVLILFAVRKQGVDVGAVEWANVVVMS